MKFTFDKDAMIKEISIAQEIITNKSPVSILSNILLIAENNSLTIKATDSTVKFTTTIPVDIQEEGRTKRAEALVELRRIETELNEKLTNIKKEAQDVQ